MHSMYLTWDTKYLDSFHYHSSIDSFYYHSSIYRTQITHVLQRAPTYLTSMLGMVTLLGAIHIINSRIVHNIAEMRVKTCCSFPHGSSKVVPVKLMYWSSFNKIIKHLLKTESFTSLKTSSLMPSGFARTGK